VSRSSVGEEELRGIDTKPLVGHLAAWNYFMSLKNKNNAAFIKMWKAYVKKNKLPGGDSRVTNDPMEATYAGMHMWAQAVQKAGQHEGRRRAQGDGRTDLCRAFGVHAEDGRDEPPPLEAGLHRRGAGGRQFDVVWKTGTAIRAQPWSPFIAGNEKRAER